MLEPHLADAVAAAFDLGERAALSDGPVARGEQGLVWRLQTSTGTWAVKEALRKVDDNDVQFAAQFAAACRSNGVPTPEIVRSRAGSLIVTIGGARLQVTAWVELLPPDLMLDPVVVGEAVAGIHRTAFDQRGPVDPWFTEPVGAAAWGELEQRLRAENAPFVDQFAAMRGELAAMDEWVRPPREVRTCHRDLWADNLRPTAAGGVCVIDWQDCGPADPGDELACMLVEFGGGDPSRVKQLYTSYVDSGGPGRVTARGDFSMLIAQLGHICQIACMDWLDPVARGTDRQHNAARFAEFVDRPHDRAGLERILDAISGIG